MSGWVRNMPDGAVEAVFEGDPDGVSQLVAYCHEGPRGAQLDAVEVTDEVPEGIGGFHDPLDRGATPRVFLPFSRAGLVAVHHLVEDGAELVVALKVGPGEAASSTCITGITPGPPAVTRYLSPTAAGRTSWLG